MIRRSAVVRRLRRLMPRTLQARLSLAFAMVIALTLGLVSVFVVNRLDDYFTRQQQTDLKERHATVSAFIRSLSETAAPVVVNANGVLDPDVINTLESSGYRGLIADRLAQADVVVRYGLTVKDETGTPHFVEATNGSVFLNRRDPPAAGQARERTSVTAYVAGGVANRQYTMEITLADPYTYRATAINNVTGLLIAIGLFALGLAVVVSAALARRFTNPIRQLTDASRALAEGDLTRRVPAAQFRAGSSEIGELAVQFNTMADRLAESVELIRRDRDRSRDFLADVSHELRTPLAALRTFNQLLMEGAAEDPDARGEFLESSAGQIDRLDWLAQNLLELSKLDSGLVLLDLRPDDLRAAVESATHQHDALAKRRGVKVELDLPTRPVRIRHDPPRIGQVVANLVGNAVKFTPRGGVVRVSVEPTAEGARIDVVDTGVGIDAERAAPYLRTVLSRLACQRGTRIGERPRTGHRPLDRRHPWRHRQRRERAGRGEPLHGPSADRPAERRRHARSRTGRRRDGRGRDAADRRRSPDRRPARTLRRISGCGAHRDGNFTVRRSPRESGVGTLESDTEPRLAAHRPGATAT